MGKSKATASTKVSAKSVKAPKASKSTKATAAEVTVTATVSSTRNASRKGMSYAKLSVSEKLSVISARKRRGDNTVIAQKLGVDSKFVSAVVTGRKLDTKVVNAMYNTVRSRKVTA